MVRLKVLGDEVPGSAGASLGRDGGEPAPEGTPFALATPSIIVAGVASGVDVTAAVLTLARGLLHWRARVVLMSCEGEDRSVPEASEAFAGPAARGEIFRLQLSGDVVAGWVRAIEGAIGHPESVWESVSESVSEPASDGCPVVLLGWGARVLAAFEPTLGILVTDDLPSASFSEAGRAAARHASVRLGRLRSGFFEELAARIPAAFGMREPSRQKTRS